MVGNPARQIGWMSEMGHKLIFDENNKAFCKGDGGEYVLEDGRVRKVVGGQ